MSRLVETIKCEDGNILNLKYHSDRMKRSCRAVFGIDYNIDLEKEIKIPSYAFHGIFKCRVVYCETIFSVEFIPYTKRKIKSLKLIYDNNIEYPFKYENRDYIDNLLLRKGQCDDILIIKNGFVTDCSFANVVFKTQKGEWLTPSTYLLRGTQREMLLDSGIIKEASIRYTDIQYYTELRIINSMIGLQDTEGIPVYNVAG